MKKSFKFLCLMLTVFMMTGCMKYEWTMSVNKDKSMNYEMIVALPSSMMQQYGADQLTEDNEELQSIKDAGFEVKDYSDGSLTGYTFTKKFENIDDVSSEKETNYNISEDITEKNPKIFTVKKGFFKNTYTLKINNETSDELQNGMNSFDSAGALTETDDTTIIDDTVTTPNEVQDTNTPNAITPDTDDATSDSAIGLDAMASSMDITFNMNLPYKAVSSNATSTENDGKNLKWNLLDQNLENINATFELYNMNNIYLTIGIAAVIIIIIIILIIRKITKKKTKKENDTPNNMPINDVTETQTPIIPEVNQNISQTNPAQQTEQTINPLNNTFQQSTPVETQPLNSFAPTNIQTENNLNSAEQLNTDLTNNINQIYEEPKVETLDNTNLNTVEPGSTLTQTVEPLTPDQTSQETEIETLDFETSSTQTDEKQNLN